jgi:hypothetical protein
MNSAMKREHFQQITDGIARKMYNRLCDACEMRADGMTDADQMLVADVAYAEQLKQMLIQDVKDRGIGEERHNGRQRYWQENKSPAQIRAISEQQRKHLAELKLTPSGRKAAPVEINDDFDSFPD